MLKTSTYPKFEAVRTPERSGVTHRYPVVVVGAGPLGMAAAIDCRLQGIEPIVRKGVEWNVGRTLFRDQAGYSFERLPQPDQKRPGIINLQQCYRAEFQARRCNEVGAQVRWKNKVVSVAPRDDGGAREAQTPHRSYRLEADWLIVADGARRVRFATCSGSTSRGACSRTAS